MDMENRLLPQTSTPKRMEFQYLSKITDQFSEELEIGSGGFGTVYKGKKDDGRFFAVKKLKNIPGIGMDDKQFLNEVHVMDISHPNIVKLEGYCYHVDRVVKTHQGKRILADDVHRLLCFEYLPNGSLEKYLQKDKSCVLDWNERYNIILGICKGLQYLHEGQGGAHILHLDLKPANVLLDEYMIPRIADFGQSRLWLFGQGQTHTANIVGTLGYMAPEYMGRGKLTKAADIYSLGVIIMEIVAGEKKFPNDDPQQFNEIVRGKWKKRLETRNHEYEQVDTCVEVALKCMVEDPQKRPVINEIIRILGISENMNSRPVGTKEHRVVVNINSVEEEERVGLVQRHTTRDNKMSMLEMMESSTVAAAKTTQQFVMEIKNHNETLSSIFYCLMIGIFIICVIGMSFSGIILGIVTYFEEEPAMVSIVVHVEEASLSRFALVTSPSPAVLNYNLTVTMSIYTPPPYELQTTKPLEAAFFFSGRRFHVVPLIGTGEMLSKTRLFSRGPLTGEVALPGDAGVVAEYRNSTRMFGVELVLTGQVMYMNRYAICKVEATCPLKLRLESPAGTTTAPAFEKVKCQLAKMDSNCYVRDFS